MQSYVVRVYRKNPDNLWVSGTIEDIESGQKEFFHSFDDLQSTLAQSIEKGQLELPNLAPEELNTYDKVAAIG